MKRNSWKEVAQIADGGTIEVHEVYLPEKQMSLRGQFESPPLSQLKEDELIFIAAFVKSHGSIKAMEKLFGISYPSVKSRLNEIGAKLDSQFNVEVQSDGEESDRQRILDDLSEGKIQFDEAMKQIQELS